MDLAPVQLHRQPRGRPERVDDVPGDLDVQLRQWQAVTLAEQQKAILEHAPGVGEGRQVLLEGSAEHGRATRPPAEPAIKRSAIESSPPVRLG